MTATVVARENPFSEQTITFKVNAGQTVAELLKRWLIPNFCYVTTVANGETCSTNYEIKDNDLITVKFVPGISLPATPGAPSSGVSAPSTGGLPGYRGTPQQKPKNPIGGYLLGAAALGAGWWLSRESDKRTGDSDPLSTNPFAASPFSSAYTPEPFAGIGGAKDKLLYTITGVANRSNPWDTFPYLAGTLDVYPVHIAKPYTYAEAFDQRLVAALCFGYGPLDIDVPQIGDKSLQELGINYELREGAAGDAAHTLYTHDVEELEVNASLKANNWVTKQAPQAADRLSVFILMPDGLYKNVLSVVNGVTVIKQTAASISFRFEYRAVGSTGAWTSLGDRTFSSTQLTAFRIPFNFNVPRGHYDMRVLRLNADAVPDLVNTSSWAVLQAVLNTETFRPIYDAKGNRVYFGTLELDAKASEKRNGVLDAVHCRVSHKVPVWNGSEWSAPQVSSNPAWRVVDMLTGPVNNSEIDKSELILEDFLAWANFCESKDIQFDHMFDSETDLEDAINTVCAVGRAALVQRDGKYTVVFDGPQSTPRQLFSSGNTRDYTWHRAWPEIPQVLEISFLNRNNQYERDYRLVYADAVNQAATNLKRRRIELPGVVRPEQVWRHGRYLHRVMRLRPITHEFTCDIQHLVANVGDLVLYRSDVAKLGLGQGLIKSVTTNGGGDITHIEIDQAQTMEAGKTYSVAIRLSSDNSIIRRTLVTAEGETYTLQFATPIPAATDPKPVAGDHFTFGEQSLEAHEMLIANIAQLNDFEARITLVDYSPSIFKNESESVPPFAPHVSEPHEVKYQPPQPRYFKIQSNEDVLLEAPDGAPISRIVISMLPPDDHRVTDWMYRIKRAGAEVPGKWILTPVSQDSISITEVEDGVRYDIEIRAFAPPGKTSEPLYISDYLCVGKTSKPPGVTNLALDGTGRRILWDIASRPRDLVGYRLKWAYGHYQVWENMQLAAHLVTAEHFSMDLLPVSGFITLAVKSVDMLNLESEEAAYIVLGLGDAPVANVVATTNYHPTFPGTKTDCSIVGNELHADDLSGLMWQANSNAPMWSLDASQLMWGGIAWKRCTYEFEYRPDASLIGLPFRLLMRPGQELIIEADGYLIEYQAPGDALMWNTQPGGENLPMWSIDPNALMWNGEGVWRPWPGVIDGSVQTYKFRITLFESNRTQGKIKQVAIKADMPDKVLRLADFEVNSASGERAPIGGAFRSIEAISIALKNDPVNHPEARHAQYIDKSATAGPLIKVFDAANDGTTGIVDLVFYGY